MERRICTAHRNKISDFFCWDCQTVICAFCMQEHSKHQHKTFPLRGPTKPRKSKEEVPRDKSAKAKKQPVESPKEEVKAPPAMPPEPRIQPRKLEPIPETLCIKCGNPANQDKELTLSCGHVSHRDCLKAYFGRSNKFVRILVEANQTRKLLFDVVCPRCSMQIDYIIMESVDSQSASELSLRTAIGDEESM